MYQYGMIHISEPRKEDKTMLGKAINAVTSKLHGIRPIGILFDTISIGGGVVVGDVCQAGMRNLSDLALDTYDAHTRQITFVQGHGPWKREITMTPAEYKKYVQKGGRK